MTSSSRPTRIPIRRGALAGAVRPGRPDAADIIDDALEGRIEALWIFGHDLAKLVGEEKLEQLSRKLDLFVFSGTNENPTPPRPTGSCPPAAHVEKDGTFVNCHGRVQRIGRAFPPLRRFAGRLARPAGHRHGRLDHPLAWRNPQEIFGAMAQALPPFGGLSYETIGFEGHRSARFPHRHGVPRVAAAGDRRLQRV